MTYIHIYISIHYMILVILDYMRLDNFRFYYILVDCISLFAYYLLIYLYTYIFLRCVYIYIHNTYIYMYQMIGFVC